MTDWLLVLMVLSVAAVLACFRFAGCALIYDYSGYKAEYSVTIKGETSLLAYWRLGEPSTTVAGDFPTPGDAAKDEIGSTPGNPTGDHPGTYQKTLLMADPPSKSPATADPPILNAGQQGLVPATAPSQTSVQVNGGFVSVPFSSTFNPVNKSFSVEAWVNAEWDLMGETDVFRCVVTSRQDTGTNKFGYILYAGPVLDPTTFATTDPTLHWQAWVGDGTTWVMLVGPVVEGGPTYLLLTHDDAQTLTLDVCPASAVTSTRQTTTQAAYKAVTDTTVPLFIGMGTPESMPPHYPFLGRLQEIAFYNEALTPAQVAAHVKAAKGEGT